MVTQVSSNVVFEKKRFDANYFKDEVLRAKSSIKSLDEYNKINTINELSKKIFKQSRFKRNYVDSKTGEPYLTPTDMFMFPLQPRKYIKDFPKGLKSERKWILLTRSGTVGRSIIANKPLSTCILSDDLIRIIPKENKLGYLYTYLNSWMGKALLKKDKFGMTVKHIDPHQVEEIPIPKLPEIEEKIHKKIKKSFELKEKTYELIQKSKNYLHNKLNLPRIFKKDANYLGQSQKSFTINNKFLDKRLDASYHVPWVQLVTRAMQKQEERGKGEKLFLKNVSKKRFVPPRFKRIYVKDLEKGIPMLQSSHIDQIQPQGVKLISKDMKNLEKYIIKENWLLVTCSGKIGKTSLVSSKWDGWAASNHMIRIIPNKKKIHPGYLTAFLQSKYGQIQFERLSYGGVVDEIGESGELVDDIIIFKPNDYLIEEEIGSIVLEAYNKRDEANELEKEAIQILENHIKNST